MKPKNHSVCKQACYSYIRNDITLCMINLFMKMLRTILPYKGKSFGVA